MRKILFLGFLLYNLVSATRFQDYDDEKRHAATEDRRNWRKKILLQSSLNDHKDWDDRYTKKPEYETQRYLGDDIDRMRDMDQPTVRHDVDKIQHIKSSESYLDKEFDELKQSARIAALEKESEKKMPMNCDRDHERFENCFAGCAAVSCDNPRERLRPCYPFCEPGCVCVPPYVRDDRTHKCVLPEDCTKGLKGIPDLGDNDEAYG